MSKTIHVFAYGSNLCIERMQARIDTATPVRVGYVTHHRLVFHKRSIDGSAKADAHYTGLETDRVWGAVYRLPRELKPVLDRYEFLGVGYDEAAVHVLDRPDDPPSHLGGGSASRPDSELEWGAMSAWMYVARAEAIDARLRPYTWYRDFVVQGALQHGLPASYIDELRRQPAWQDPDRQRHAANRRLIRGR